MEYIDEMIKLCYIVVICDLDDFMCNKYFLCLYLFNCYIELFIVMIMYNEDEVLFVCIMNVCVIFFVVLWFDRLDLDNV